MDPVLGAGLLGVFWFVAVMASLIVAIRLKRYRIDIGPNDSPWEGESWAGNTNVLSRKNYSEEGQLRLPWLYGLIAFQMACVFAAMIIMVW